MVRYGGGPQAAHNVITPDGIHHTFAQLGSGMFVDNSRTVLSEYMLIEPAALMTEEEIFCRKVGKEIKDRVYIDENCYIITPYDRALGRIKSIALNKSTCGMGVGVAADSREWGTAIQVKDIVNTKWLREKLEIISINKTKLAADLVEKKSFKLFQGMVDIDIEKIISIYKMFYNRYNIIDRYDFLSKEIKDRNLIFEGSQGILLDKDIGFKPHITNCNVTTKNAISMLWDLSMKYIDDEKFIGILRPYSHRHGCGPLPTETKDISWKKDEHNINNEWQKEFRYGWFDYQLVKYAIEKTAIDLVALTNLDRMQDKIRVCENYLYKDKVVKDLCLFSSNESIVDVVSNSVPNKYQIINKEDFVGYLEATFNVRINIISSGPTANEKQWR